MSSCAVDKHQLAAEIRQFARRLGFDLVGIAPAEPSRYRDYFRAWIDAGKAGAMTYLDERFAERVDPTRYFEGARSIICVALNYNPPGQPDSAAEVGMGTIARYARGDDYHELIKHRLYELADWLRATVPGAQTRCGVDTVPVMEKELAARAGIGWLGKNACIINAQIGSWLLLGEVLTTLDLPHDDPAIDRCGTCTRCIEACPTRAITAPYQLDATRCISYLTIEHGERDVPAEFHRSIGDWIFGCDICQEVCPWNRGAPTTMDPALHPRFIRGRVDLREVLGWREHEPNPLLSGSAIKRVKLPILQRNARIVMNNQGVT